MVILVGGGVIFGAVLVVEAGFTSVILASVAGGCLAGILGGLAVPLPDHGGPLIRGRSLAAMTLAGIGIANAVRHGPPWLRVAFVSPVPASSFRWG